eukprot:3722029-Alexandrium_andersonii.AAC.1
MPWPSPLAGRDALGCCCRCGVGRCLHPFDGAGRAARSPTLNDSRARAHVKSPTTHADRHAARFSAHGHLPPSSQTATLGARSPTA